ncbi:MAG: hypothetical protein ACH350_01070 [Parachlamydiaceae bacterium]
MTVNSSYRDVHYHELLPLFDNLVKVGDHASRQIYKIVIPLLMGFKYSSIPVQGCYLAGSSLTNLFAASTEYNDIDMKIIVKGDQNSAKQLFSLIGQLFFLTIDGCYYCLDNLAHKTFKPVYLPGSYSFTAYSIQGYGQHHPFDISVIVTDHFNGDLPTVMNIDSLFVPLVLFQAVSSVALGSSDPLRFHLQSAQGDCEAVIENIKKRVLTCQDPARVKKFGWVRYLNAITEGFICKDPEVNRIFCATEMKNPHFSVYSMYQFMQKKKRSSFDVHWIFFICNAIFQCPDKEILNDLLRNFTSLLEHQKQSVTWMADLKAMLPIPFPLEEIPILLQLFLPLLSQSVILKHHVEKNWLQCEFKEGEKNFYLLIPYECVQNRETLSVMANIFETEQSFIFPDLTNGNLPLEESCLSLLSDIHLFQKSPLAKELIRGWSALCPTLSVRLSSEKKIFNPFLFLPFFHLFEEQDRALITHHALKAIHQKDLNDCDLLSRSLLPLLQGYCNMQRELAAESEVLLGIKLCLQALCAEDQHFTLSSSKESVLRNLSKKLRSFDQNTINTAPLIREISSFLIRQLLKKENPLCFKCVTDLFIHIHVRPETNNERDDFLIDLDVYCTILEHTTENSPNLTLIYAHLPALFFMIPHQENRLELTLRFSKMLLSLSERKIPPFFATLLIPIGFELLLGTSGCLSFPDTMNTQEATTRFLSFVLSHTQPNQWYYDEILPVFYQVLDISSDLIEPLILQKFITKALEAAKTFKKNKKVKLHLSKSVTLLSYCYKTCSDYDTSFLCKGTDKPQVMEALRNVLSFANEQERQEEMERFLIDLNFHGFLDAQFINDIAQEVAIAKNFSIANGYCDIFMNPFFKNYSVSWTILIKSIKNITIASWQTQEINLFMRMFCSLLNQQFSLSPHKQVNEKIYLSYLFSFYLQLTTQCSEFSLSIDLVENIIDNPQRYLPLGRPYKEHLLTLFEIMGQKIAVVGYHPMDLKEKKVHAFLTIFHRFWKTLSAEEQNNHQSIASKLNPPGNQKKANALAFEKSKARS